MITGRSYLERGELITVLAQWSRSPVAASWVYWLRPPKAGAPRNVLIQRADGSWVVRPFRGLRVLPTERGDIEVAVARVANTSVGGKDGHE